MQGWESLWLRSGRGVGTNVGAKVGTNVGCGRGRGKKFGALGCRKREFVRPQKQALYSPKFLATC